MNEQSPFSVADARPISRQKFQNADITADGEQRAIVSLTQLETLWFNTGTLCNLACKNCYIESSPINDALVYLTLAEVLQYLAEIENEGLSTREIAFTGGEPFMNPDFMDMLKLCLGRGFDVLVLSNAMRPMRRFEKELLQLPNRDNLTVRVSLDHFTQEVHEAERGPNSWNKAIDGLIWLTDNGFKAAIAGRHLGQESTEAAREGYAKLFQKHALNIDPENEAELALFPEMDATLDTPEITTSCWQILGVNPDSIMCANSRMVVKRKGEQMPRVAACTLLPYDLQFDMGGTLVESSQDVKLNHPHCSRFCVLGGASCSA
ncbi:MAG: radical SAM protein [Parasphingorhabdus sp.]